MTIISKIDPNAMLNDISIPLLCFAMVYVEKDMLELTVKSLY